MELFEASRPGRRIAPWLQREPRRATVLAGSPIRQAQGWLRRHYSENAGDTPASTAAQLIHRLNRSLSVFSLAKEDQVNENAQHRHGHDDHLLQVFRIKGPRRNCPRCGTTMTTMMIDDGKRVAAGGARFQWHMIPIADIDLIARNTGKKWGRVSTPKVLPRSQKSLPI